MDKAQVVAQNYDLSASRYRQIEQDEVFYENPTVTLDRMRALERTAESQVKALERMLADGQAKGVESRKHDFVEGKP